MERISEKNSNEIFTVLLDVFIIWQSCLCCQATSGKSRLQFRTFIHYQSSNACKLNNYFLKLEMFTLFSMIPLQHEPESSLQFTCNLHYHIMGHILVFLLAVCGYIKSSIVLYSNVFITEVVLKSSVGSHLGVIKTIWLPKLLFKRTFVNPVTGRERLINSKSFVSKVLLRIKWKFELTVHFKHEMLGK